MPISIIPVIRRGKRGDVVKCRLPGRQPRKRHRCIVAPMSRRNPALPGLWYAHFGKTASQGRDLTGSFLRIEGIQLLDPLQKHLYAQHHVGVLFECRLERPPHHRVVIVTGVVTIPKYVQSNQPRNIAPML